MSEHNCCCCHETLPNDNVVALDQLVKSLAICRCCHIQSDYVWFCGITGSDRNVNISRSQIFNHWSRHVTAAEDQCSFPAFVGLVVAVVVAGLVDVVAVVATTATSTVATTTAAATATVTAAASHCGHLLVQEGSKLGNHFSPADNLAFSDDGVAFQAGQCWHQGFESAAKVLGCISWQLSGQIVNGHHLDPMEIPKWSINRTGVAGEPN